MRQTHTRISHIYVSLVPWECMNIAFALSFSTLAASVCKGDRPLLSLSIAGGWRASRSRVHLPCGPSVRRVLLPATRAGLPDPPRRRLPPRAGHAGAHRRTVRSYPRLPQHHPGRSLTPAPAGLRVRFRHQCHLAIFPLEPPSDHSPVRPHIPRCQGRVNTSPERSGLWPT